LAGGARDSEELHIIPIAFVATAIFCKGSLCVYCFIYRRYPAVHVFFIDHRNDIVVNAFGLAMSIVGSRVVWYVDPIGAILIGLLILFSWAANAFDHVWLLVGKSAPKDFISKLIYLVVTHDDRIQKVDTCRAYHAGQNYYVEVDIVMDEGLPLKVTHDVSQTLQRKLEGKPPPLTQYHCEYGINITQVLPTLNEPMSMSTTKASTTSSRSTSPSTKSLNPRRSKSASRPCASCSKSKKKVLDHPTMCILYYTMLRAPKVDVFFYLIYTPAQQYTRLRMLLLIQILFSMRQMTLLHVSEPLHRVHVGEP
jgi:hypothetical protein